MSRSKEAFQSHIPEDIYAKIIESVPIACVDIVVVYDHQALLVKRMNYPARGEWWIPGGRVLWGEMMVDTAQRKAREELGVDVHVGPLVHTSETMFPVGPTGVPVHTINSCFCVFPVDDNCKFLFDNQHDHYRWVNAVEDCWHSYIKRCLNASGF